MVVTKEKMKTYVNIGDDRLEFSKGTFGRIASRLPFSGNALEEIAADLERLADPAIFVVERRVAIERSGTSWAYRVTDFTFAAEQWGTGGDLQLFESRYYSREDVKRLP